MWHCVKGPIHDTDDSDLQSQPRFPTATSTKFPVYGLRQPQPPPWLADRCCGCCWSEFSDIWSSLIRSIFRSEVRHCYYQRTEKDWTDRSLRVWVDHQQQPRSGCTLRLRLKSLSWMGPLRLDYNSSDSEIVIKRTYMRTYMSCVFLTCDSVAWLPHPLPAAAPAVCLAQSDCTDIFTPWMYNWPNFLK